MNINENNDNLTVNQNEKIDEIKETLEETSHTKEELSSSLELDKISIKRKLARAKNVEDRVKLFAKVCDKFWVEALAWLIPIIGDLTPTIVCTCYLLIEGMNIWLSRKDCLRILWYQTADILVWSVPVIGDIADFFFKSNKYSSKIFTEHVKKLKKAALEKWITQEEIDKLWITEKKFIKAMDTYVDKKQKKKNKNNKN